MCNVTYRLMAGNIIALLTTIEAALQRLGRGILIQSLRSGISIKTLRSQLTAAELSSSAELESLYGWRNGTSAEIDASLDDVHIFPGFYLLSIEEAIANYHSFVADSRWTPGWLPIFGNGGGDFYVYDMNSPPAHPVRHFRIEEAEHPVEFGSLEAMMTTLAEAFQRGVFFVDSNSYLEMDDLAFGELAAELNPEIDWWQG